MPGGQSFDRLDEKSHSLSATEPRPVAWASLPLFKKSAFRGGWPRHVIDGIRSVENHHSLHTRGGFRRKTLK
jgi:hypothetical protein